MTRPPREAEEPERVTLAPLTPEEALRALLAVPAAKPDDGSDHPARITVDVDGEVFSVQPGGQPRSYDYRWLSGPDEGYGFTSRDSSPRSRSLEDHREAIRDFLEPPHA